MRGLTVAMLVLLSVAATACTHGRAAVPETNSFAIRDVRLFDGERVVARANVTIRQGIVAAVGPDIPIPPDLPVIDGRGKTLHPGLIDSHVHVFRGAQEDAVRFGVTAEMDMFTLAPDFAAWRAHRESLSRTAAADTWSAGLGVSAPNGHPSGIMPGSAGIPTLGSAADADAFVAARAAEGADFIKIIMEDNSFLAPGNTIPALTIEEVCASVRAAHRLGKLAIVHATRARDARAAVECDADGLAHLFADEVASPEFVRLARDRGIFVQTTLAVVAAGSSDRFSAELYGPPGIQALLSAGQRQILEMGFRSVRPRGIDTALRSARLLHAGGVPLIVGSDAPNPGAPHGLGVHAEMQLLVKAGLSPVETLKAATTLPARVFGLTDRGVIAVGRRADLVMVHGDPTRAIEATLDIDTIWKNGFAVTRAPPSVG